MVVDNGKYFLYRHIRLDKNEPFYIGGYYWSHRDTYPKFLEIIYTKNGNNNL